MSKIGVVRKEDGRLFKDKKGRCVFEKDGVYFALSDEQMADMKNLIDEVQAERSKAGAEA